VDQNPFGEERRPKNKEIVSMSRRKTNLKEDDLNVCM
jgi:hypothetical protein